MAKPSITSINTATDTFQSWVDSTNVLISIMQTEAITASVSGDTTGTVGAPLSAQLIGTFTANNVIASDILRTDNIAGKVGSLQIAINDPVVINSNVTNVATFNSTVGPRNLFAGPSTNWSIGFENISTSNFTITTGVGATKLTLTPTGDLTILGTISGTQFTGNAATATKLENPVTINGVPFDGSQNITFGSSTSGTLVRGTYLTGANFNGAVSTTWAVDATSVNTPSKIVARDNVGNFSAGTITASFVGTLTGNASTASTLQTSRTINGESFNGSSNISVPVSVQSVTSSINCHVLFTGAQGSGNQPAFSNPSFRFNPFNGRLTTTELLTSSDIALKEDVSTIANALDKVNSLRGVNFTWKNTKEKSIGLIAQEVENIIPEIVDSTGMFKTMSYNNLVALLVEAIKELDRKISSSENK